MADAGACAANVALESNEREGREYVLVSHSFGRDCPLCGEGASGVRCDLSTYSPRRVRFVLAHREAYEAAYLNPNRAAASNEIERLEREYHTLPPRHVCTCWCSFLRERQTGNVCTECARRRANSVRQDVGVVIGRTTHVHPPMPSAAMLDLARAEHVLGDTDDAEALARYMSLNGTSLATDPNIADRAALTRHHPRADVVVEREMLCLMCSRTAATGQQECQWCGGSLMVA